MKRLAWLTDIHLEFLDDRGVEDFCQSVVDLSPDAVLIGGDISNASNIERHLDTLEKHTECPIYFVLGNHDFYGGSIEDIRSLVQVQTRGSRRLNWLPVSGVVELADNTGLIGHGGWADGRLGRGAHSQVLLNDYFHIGEFIGLSQNERFEQLNTFGDQAAGYFRNLLPEAAERFPNLLLLTHVPPFRESCWYRGNISSDEYLPHFACQVVGEVLTDVMRGYPESNLTVLCGHTHSRGEVKIASNLSVKTGKAVYGSPQVQELIVVR